MNKNTIITVALGALVLIGGVFYFYTKSLQTNTASTSPVSSSVSIPTGTTERAINTKGTGAVAKTAPTTPVSTTPAAKPTISGVSMSTALTTSGAAVNPATTFSPTTPTIYAVLSLKNATARTQLSYVRYYEGKYVDSKVSHPSTDNVKYFHFSWILKAGQTRKVGNYSLVFYVDGKKASTVNYAVR